MQFLDGADQQAEVVESGSVRVECVVGGGDWSQAQGLALEGERAAAAVDAIGVLASSGLVDLVAEVGARLAAQEVAVEVLAAVDVSRSGVRW